MKTLRNALILILAFSLLCGCAGGKPAGTDDGPDTAMTEDTAGTEDAVKESKYPVKSVKIDGEDLSAFHILYAEEDGPSVRTAVSDLQKYIEFATGEKLNVTTDAGAPGKRIAVTVTNEDTENYLYKSDENGVTISGGRTRGAMYGVYGFLENCLGIRFLASDTDYCYPSDGIELNALDYSYTQYFEYRDSFWTDYFDLSISAKRMINANTNRKLTEEYGGGISYAEGYFAHTITQLAELEDTSAQPCFCDEEVYQTTLKNVMKIMEEHPDTKIIPISQIDGRAEFCRCRECLKVLREDKCEMGAMLRFINRIAEAVDEKYPGVMIQTLAYLKSRKPPKVTVPRENVIIQVCTAECCFNHSLGSEECEDNADLKSDLENWGKICTHMWTWDYVTNFKYYLMPFPNLHVLRDNVRFFAENHVTGLFEEGNYNSVNGEFGELRAYLLARLMQNPYMTEEEYDEEIDVFLKGYYGAGWENIRNYLDFVQACGATHDHFGMYDPYEKIIDVDAFRENGDTLVAWFDEAEALADDEKTLEHVRHTRISCDYMRLTVLYDDMIASDDEADRKWITDQVKNLRARIDGYGMRVHEVYETSETVECKPFDW